MKKLASYIFAGAAGLLALQAAAHAEEITCTGKYLIPDIETTEPEIAKRMLADAQAMPYGEGLTWKVEKEGLQPSYLFGTIHMSDPRLLEMRPEVSKVFDASTTLALEITEILDPKKLAGSAFATMQYTTYTDGSSLDKKLKPEDKEAISSVVREKLGLPWSVASKMKPWALMGALGLPTCEMARKRAKKPVVDTQLGQMAKEQGKNIVALETMLGQLEAMDSLPEEVALKGLVQSASLGTRLDDLFETMIQLYLEEKTALIWSLMRRVAVEGFVPARENAEYAAFQREIVDRRNVTMTQEAEKLLKQGNAFIAVGALHLPGQHGMLNILAQKGYQISRLTP